MYNQQQQPVDINAFLARIQAQLQGSQQPQESPGARDLRLAMKHGIDPTDGAMLTPQASGPGSALRGAAKDAVKSAATSL